MIINKQAVSKTDTSLIIDVFETNKLDFPFHFHSGYYELTYLSGCSGVRMVGNHFSEFSNTDLVLLPPGMPHSWVIFNPQNKAGIIASVITIHFSMDLFPEGVLHRPCFLEIQNLLKSVTRGISLNNTVHPGMAASLSGLKLEPDLDTYLGLIKILHQLAASGEIQFLTDPSYTYRGHPKEQYEFPVPFAFLQKNFTRRIKISEAANLINLNDTAYSHYFMKRTQMTFTDFINTLRLYYAAGYLRFSEMKISEICLKSGFNNLSNFNRQFKKWSGFTPQKYRNRFTA